MWYKVPIFRVLLPLSLGIILNIGLEFQLLYFQFIFLIFGILLTLIVQSKYLTINDSYVFSHYFIYIFLGILLVGAYKSQKFRNHYTNYVNESVESIEAVFVVHTSLKERNKSVYLEAELEKLKLNNRWLKLKGKLPIYLEKENKKKYNQIEIGDRIQATIKLNSVDNIKPFAEFDYGKYLKSQFMFHTGYIRTNQWNKLGPSGFNIRLWALRIRKRVSYEIDKKWFSANESSVLKALLLGDKKELSRKLKKSYASVGAMHILAVSGLHVGIIYLLLLNLLFFMNYSLFFKRLKILIILLVLCLYALVTGLSPSVVRSVIMFGFMAIGTHWLNRRGSTYNSLFSSALLILLIDPFMIKNIGFQLSYAAVLGILSFQPIIYKSLYFRNIILDKVWALTTVSIAAQLAVLPFTLYYFKHFSVYFLVTNILVIPLAAFILCLGWLFICSCFIFGESITALFAWITNSFLIFLNTSVALIEKFPFAYLTIGKFSIINTLFLSFFIILLGFFLTFFKKSYIWMSLLLLICFLGIRIFEKGVVI